MRAHTVYIADKWGGDSFKRKREVLIKCYFWPDHGKAVTSSEAFTARRWQRSIASSWGFYRFHSLTAARSKFITGIQQNEKFCCFIWRVKTASASLQDLCQIKQVKLWVKSIVITSAFIAFCDSYISLLCHVWGLTDMGFFWADADANIR